MQEYVLAYMVQPARRRQCSIDSAVHHRDEKNPDAWSISTACLPARTTRENEVRMTTPVAPPPRKTRGRPKLSEAPPRRRKEYLAERIYREMRERIYTGVYRPGQHLKEEDLVAELGASRSVIRQALTQLAAEGLLEDRPKLGKYVSEFTEEMIAKLVPIRVALEQVAVRAAIDNLTAEDETELRSLAARICEPGLTLAEQDALDVAIHRKIWKLAGNHELEKLLTRVVGPFHIVGAAVFVSPYYRRGAAVISAQQILQEHERHSAGHQPLVDAICARDIPTALKAISEHIISNYEWSAEEFSRRIAELLKTRIQTDGSS